MSDEQDGFDCLVENPGQRIALIQAELAAREKEALEAIKGDICDWLSRTLSIRITVDSFLDVLDTGVDLCRLATLIQKAAKEMEVKGRPSKCKVPLSPLSCNSRAKKGTFFARDNTSNFIDWCRDLGVEETVIFESEGLVLHKDEKRVILCLLDVARFADRVGISPPELVRMEKEIEELEAREMESSSKSPRTTTNDDRLQELTLISPQVEHPSFELPRLPKTTSPDDTSATIPLEMLGAPSFGVTIESLSTHERMELESSNEFQPALSSPKPSSQPTLSSPKAPAPSSPKPPSQPAPLSPKAPSQPAPSSPKAPSQPAPSSPKPPSQPAPLSPKAPSQPAPLSPKAPSQPAPSSPKIVSPPKSPSAKTRPTKIPSPVHTTTKPRSRQPTAMPPGSRKVTAKRSVSPIATRVQRSKRQREEEETGEQKIKRQRKEAVESEPEKKHESVDEKVMRRVNECTCSKKFEVKSCGKGKFIVQGSSGRKMTVYARLLSDRVMVRVGGGWDSLDHFLLKHDPCRIHAITLAEKKKGSKAARALSPQEFLKASSTQQEQ